ncbi:MAG: DUF418 domain-containing protein [Pseudomonadota bacterium]
MMSKAARSNPIAAADRMQILDILRGFALFGILLANMIVFSGLLFVWALPDVQLTTFDQVVYYTLEVLLHGKFYSIFSILFGIGFTVFLTRAGQRGAGAKVLFAPRLALLFVIGLIHATLIWAGDILMLYAMIGFVLLLFHHCRSQTLLYGALGLLLLKIVLYGLMWASGMDHPMRPSNPDPNAGPPMPVLIIAGYQSGYPDILQSNAYQLFGRWMLLIISLRPPAVLAMFLLGMWIGRVGLAADLDRFRALINRVAAIGLGLGLPLNGLWVWLVADSHRYLPGSAMGLLEVAVGTFGVPLLALGYMALIAVLMRRDAVAAGLSWLAPVGRMALTNYLMQSVCCIFIFYGAGLGFYGTVGHAKAALFVLPVFLIQIPLSAWWLTRFRYGPMEWLWRSLTYGQRMPLRRMAS